MSWFFKSIQPSAGDAQIEEKAFSVASYGKQLGLITEVLIDHAEQLGTTSGDAAESLERLKVIRQAIEQIKTTERSGRVMDIAARVAEVRRKGGSAYEDLSEVLLPLLRVPDV